MHDSISQISVYERSKTCYSVDRRRVAEPYKALHSSRFFLYQGILLSLKSIPYLYYHITIIVLSIKKVTFISQLYKHLRQSVSALWR